MSLTRPTVFPIPKTSSRSLIKKAAARGKASAAEKKHFDAVARLGCIVGRGCAGAVTLHHCGTHMGGGRNNANVIPLCWEHHLGAGGIDGKRMSKREWEKKYGTEETLLERVREAMT
jgi:hypothetical protein